MSSNLKVNTVLPSVGTAIGIGTAGGSVSITSDTITALTGGSERLRINSDGAVLLGTTTASNAESFRIHTSDSGKAIIKLTNSTTGTGSGDGFEFGMNGNEQIEFVNKENTDMFFATNNTERLRINSSGQVLIGTTNNTTIGTVNKNLIVGSTTNNDEVALTLNVMEGVHGRRVKLFLDDDDGVFGVDSTASTGVPPFVVRMATSEKFRIDTEGRVLIGTTSTAGAATDLKLQVFHPSHGSILVGGSDVSASGTATINLAPSNKITGSQIICSAEEDFSTSANRTANLSFKTRKDGTLAEALRISSSGHVTKPLHPAFIAGRTGGNQTFTVGTYPLNVARLNVGNHYNTSTYKFTAPVAGVYYFHAQIYYNNGSGN